MNAHSLGVCTAFVAGIGTSLAGTARAQEPEPGGALALAWERLASCVGVAVDPDAREIYALERGGKGSVLDSEGSVLREFRTTDEISLLALAHFEREDACGGRPELVGYKAWGAVAIALTCEGETRWSRRFDGGIDSVEPADLDGDGVEEVLVGLNGSAGLLALDASGRTLWNARSIGNVWTVAAGDVVGDARPEVLAASVREIHVFDAEGKPLTTIDPGLGVHRIAVLERGASDPRDRLFLAGERDGAQLVGEFVGGSELVWLRRNFECAALAVGPRGLVALGSESGRVRVVHAGTGAVQGSLAGLGGARQLAWLDGRSGARPLLLIATGESLRAYLCDPAAVERGTEQLFYNSFEALDADRSARFGALADTLAALRDRSLPGAITPELERAYLDLLPCCPALYTLWDRCRERSDLQARQAEEPDSEEDAAELNQMLAAWFVAERPLDFGDIPVDDSPCAEARRVLLARGSDALVFLVDRLRACDVSVEDGEREWSCIESLLVELADGRFDWVGRFAEGQGWGERELRRKLDLAHAWHVHTERAVARPEHWRELADRPLPAPQHPTASLSADELERGAEPTRVEFRPVKSLMTPGMRIRAKTSAGEIEIEAGLGFERSYTWGGATRSARLRSGAGDRAGPLGLYWPGLPDWEEHRGIGRGVLGEKLVSFATEADALAWLAEQRAWLASVHRNDGWVVGWREVPERFQLDVQVWRIEIAGRAPTQLAGACDECITVERR